MRIKCLCKDVYLRREGIWLENARKLSPEYLVISKISEESNIAK